MIRTTFMKTVSGFGIDDVSLRPSIRLREGERSLFLCSLFLPEPYRSAVIALYTFNLEITRIRGLINEPLAGQLRLKWWYDAVESMGAGEISNHPVIREIEQVTRDFRLDPLRLLSLVEANATDLSPCQPGNVREMLEQIDKTSGVLYKTLVNVVDANGATDALRAGAHVARAFGISRMLGSLPSDVNAGRNYLPRDICQREGVTTNDIKKLGAAEPLPNKIIEVIRAVVDVGTDELLKGRGFRKDINPLVRTVLLPATLAGQDFIALRAERFDPRRMRPRRLGLGPFSMLKLWWNARRGLY